MKRALIAMSGGVDSSVAALKLLGEGYDCTGVTMRLYRNSDLGLACHKSCCAESDAEDAEFVCSQLGIPHELLDYTGLFRVQVIQRFADEYARGRTPNPCIDCNRWMKFEALLDEALARGFDVLATGHYARITRDPDSGRWQLRKAADESKDQSYVLYMLTQRQLAHLRFPLGELRKSETRRIAEENGLVTAAKRESQDICFVPGGDYAAFLEQWTGKACPPGDILDREGRVLGRHRGAIRCTVGQRRGLGLAAGQPVYVLDKDMAANTVTVGPEEALYSGGLSAAAFHWLSIPEPAGPIRVRAMTRYRQKAFAATAVPLPGRRLRLDFDEPQRAVTPGQAVVLYDGDLVLGGGTIEAAIT